MKLAALAVAAGNAASVFAEAQLTPERGEPVAVAGVAAFDEFFLQILNGYLINSRKTCDSFAVVDFPDGTHLKTCDNPEGHGYVGVARMLPAMVGWILSGRSPQQFDVGGGKTMSLTDIVLETYRNAFNPDHPDFWGMPVNVNNKPTQRSVEASLVALSLARLGESFVEKLSPQERTNIQNWLAACTRVPERTNNHAWFTATNQAARIKLSKKFKEFSGDEKWMIDDLTALDNLYKTARDGWYSDQPNVPVFDYYAFWTFGNFPLYWAEIVGDLYPDWAKLFRDRVKIFLEKTPYFYSADGGHPLFGRSLVYRWSMLSPMVEGYRQGLWPHSPGLLRRICRMSIEWERKIGAFDQLRGKLIEIYSPGGTPYMKESYVDNGHPYWTMQGYSFLGIPSNNKFWTDPEDMLPIEKGDFYVRFDGPRFLLVGTKRSGQVRWIHSQTVARREPYRDKYIKLGYSSHFFFNIIQEENRVPWDQTVVLRDRTSGATYGRTTIKSGELTKDGYHTIWTINVSDKPVQIDTTARIDGEFEHRTHVITTPEGFDASNFDVLEGSYALGMNDNDKLWQDRYETWQSIESKSGQIISWNLGGYSGLDVEESFGQKEPKLNVVYPKFAINSLHAPLKAGEMKVTSLHYASPKPEARETIFKLAAERGLLNA
jgi:hypothetical protein